MMLNWSFNHLLFPQSHSRHYTSSPSARYLPDTPTEAAGYSLQRGLCLLSVLSEDLFMHPSACTCTSAIRFRKCQCNWKLLMKRLWLIFAKKTSDHVKSISFWFVEVEEFHLQEKQVIK